MAKATTQPTIPAKTLAAYEKSISKLEGIERKGATMPYTSLNGHMFSFIGQDGMVALRLPADIREEVMKTHSAKPCIAHGVVMKEYITIPDKLLQNTTAITKYFKLSYTYVQSLKPKATTRKATTAVTKKATGKTTKSTTSNKNLQVDDYLQKKNNPLTAEINRIREIILGVSDKIEEGIKWSAPTFMYKGNIASFFMNAKKHVSLMFHYGASIPDKHGLLDGDGAVARSAKFTDLKDIEKKKKALESIIKEWMKMKDAGK